MASKLYPIGFQDFEKIRTEADYYYVDKTQFVYELGSKPGTYFLSRPRRFGKSLLLSTFKQYFLGKRELFKGLRIESLEQKWTVRPVFYMSFGGSNFNEDDALYNSLNSMIAAFEREYGRDPENTSLGDRFKYVAAQAHKATGHRVAVLIDEYDKPLLDAFGTEMEQKNKETLSGFYSAIKDADKDEFFVFVAGITKFSQVSLFSGSNQLMDISLLPKYEAICGVTKAELEENFTEGINDMAEAKNVTPEKVLDKLKRMYDGYHFSGRLTDIYNPFSILQAIDSQNYGYYWFSSSTPSALIGLVSSSDEFHIDEITSHFYEAQCFAEYKARKEDVLPLLYHAGYLTIKEVHDDDGDMEYRLDFPNGEVTRGYTSLMLGGYSESPSVDASWVRHFVKAMKDGNIDEMRKLMTSFFAAIPYSMRPKKSNSRTMPPIEAYFHYTFYLIFRLITTYTVLIEKQNADGRADCIVETDDYVYIFEFKLDESADVALRQIEERKYAVPYAADKRKLFKIGVAFSSKDVTVSDWKID